MRYWVLATFGPTNLGAQPEPELKGFRILQGSQEIGTEVFSWSESTLEATVDVTALGRRLVTRTIYDHAGGSETLNTFLVDNGQVLSAVVGRSGGRGTLTIAGMQVDLQLGADGQLVSVTNAAQALRVEPAVADSLSASRPLAPPTEVARPAGVIEEPFEWTNGPQRLAATLTRPATAAGAVPVALIIAGSGPTDRDGNSAMGLRTDVYRKVAWALAAERIASVRYDKRGLGGSAPAPGQGLVSFDDFADDAVAGAKALAGNRQFSGVVLIGHSEGAGLATRAANRGAPVAGVVMLAGLGRGFRNVLREQVTAGSTLGASAGRVHREHRPLGSNGRVSSG